jgi:hypothetical protein
MYLIFCSFRWNNCSNVHYIIIILIIYMNGIYYPLRSWTAVQREREREREFCWLLRRHSHLTLPTNVIVFDQNSREKSSLGQSGSQKLVAAILQLSSNQSLHSTSPATSPAQILCSIPSRSSLLYRIPF